MGNASGRRRNQAAIEERRSTVIKMYLSGGQLAEIAAATGISKGTVSKDISAVRREWVKERCDDVEQLAAIELAKVALIEKHAWDGWNRSKGLERSPVGDSRFLGLLVKCSERRCRILGLDSPQKLELAMPERAVIVEDDNWYGNSDRLAAALAEREVAE